MNASWFAGLTGAFQREWRRMTSDRFYPVAMVVVPVLAAAVVSAVFDPAVLRAIPVAVCDQDGSALSRDIARRLDAAPELAVTWKIEDPGAGHALMRTGRAQTLVYLPRGLEKNLARGIPQPVVAYIGNTFLLSAGNVEKAVQSALVSASVQRAAALRMAKGAMAPMAAAAAYPIRLDTRVVFNPYLNYAHLITATVMPAMLNIVVITMSIFAFGSELRNATAGHWLAAAGGHPWAAVAGKALAHAVVFWALALAMLSWLVWDQHLVVAGSGLRLWAATMLMVAAGQAAALLFVAATANLRLALSLGGVWAVTAYPFAGITFPMVGMPMIARFWGESLPLTHYLRILFDQTLRGALPGPEVVHWSVLVGGTLVAAALAMVRLPKLARDPSCWGRR